MATKLTAAEFEAQALEHLDALFSVAMRVTRSQPDAQDLVQDTLLKAMRARSTFESGTHMRAWLLRILMNTFINRYRRGGLERSVFDGPDADPLADGWVSASSMEAMRDPESQALRPMLEREIVAALEELPEEFRAVVLLSDVEELAYKEIAETLGCPIGTVMSRLHRGRRLLKQRLYEVALSMGIVGPEGKVGESETPAPEIVHLETYRTKRGARA